METKGYSGTILFDGSFVTIVRKGFLARATIGKGEKKIPIKSISSIQWKPAGAFMNGYIEFSLGGGNESRSQFGHATMDATKNENAVIFTKKQMPEFEKLRTVLEKAMNDMSQGTAAQFAGSADISERMKELESLKTAGLISMSEYENKRSQLLSQL